MYIYIYSFIRVVVLSNELKKVFHKHERWKRKETTGVHKIYNE